MVLENIVKDSFESVLKENMYKQRTTKRQHLCVTDNCFVLNKNGHIPDMRFFIIIFYRIYSVRKILYSVLTYFTRCARNSSIKLHIS